MFGFNSKTQVNNEFKITDIVKSLGLTKEQKKEVDSIIKISLANVFNTQTLGIKASEEINLIYVYWIEVLEGLPLEFIKELDKKTNAHTIFEIINNKDITYIMANKRIADKITIGTYYIKESQEFNGATLNIDTISELYGQLLYYVCELTPKANETAEEITERKAHLISLQKEITKLERLRDKEKQPNKKIAINEQIAKMKKEISF